MQEVEREDGNEQRGRERAEGGGRAADGCEQHVPDRRQRRRGHREQIVVELLERGRHALGDRDVVFGEPRLDRGQQLHDASRDGAHELGHVWIYTHHPYLQTEREANTVAMRAVPRASLERVYTKVWEHQGTIGDLARFLGPE